MTNINDCIFCNLDAQFVVAENQFAIAIRDKFPVKPLHTLIIPKRHTCDVFDCTAAEREAMHTLAVACLDALRREDPAIEGVNFGHNIGEVAGQKIFHTHLHLIPRRKGDFAPPPARGEA